jgi:hypothetical protein
LRRRGELLPSRRPLLPRPPRSMLLDRLALLPPLGLPPAAPKRLATEPVKLLVKLTSESGAPTEPLAHELSLPCAPPLHKTLINHQVISSIPSPHLIPGFPHPNPQPASLLLSTARSFLLFFILSTPFLFTSPLYSFNPTFSFFFHPSFQPPPPPTPTPHPPLSPTHPSQKVARNANLGDGL